MIVAAFLVPGSLSMSNNTVFQTSTIGALIFDANGFELAQKGDYAAAVEQFKPQNGIKI
jgi:hypothetical protein